MSSPLAARALFLIGTGLLVGCTAFAGKSDYFDYRAQRMEHSDDARLLAMQRYVQRHPDGRWYDEVQHERERRDRAVFESGRSTRAGLTLYMQAFPDGQFASQAKSRLDAIVEIEQRKLSEQQRAAQLAEERKQRDAELSRTWVTRFFGYWTKTLLALQGWGTPIDQVARGNIDFSRAFGRPPRPRCTADECVKSYESAFAVPVPGGTRVERAMRLLLRLRMDEGKLQRAELLLPASGFSRWQELEERKLVVDGDAEARAQALSWALSRVVPLLDALAPGHQPIEGYALAPIAPIAFGVTGELTDTTAEDPSAPPNVIQGNAAPGTAAAAQPQPTTEQLLKPVAPEQAADMEMETLGVDRQGRAIQSAPQPQPRPGAAPGVPQEQGEIVLEPLAVPRADGSAPAPVAPAQPAAPQPTPQQPASAKPVDTKPSVRAFRAGALRVVVFAASPADPGGMDGVLIERDVSPKAAAAAKRDAAHKTAPRKPPAAPPAAPAH